MYGKEKTFTFFLTGKEDNDRAAEDYVRNHGYGENKCIQYKLEYTPPYKNFTGIAGFEHKTQYRPFYDSLKKKAVAIIDLSEWIGHEKEENLEIFMKFLHDYDWSFYRYEYVFTVGKADAVNVKELYALVNEYLCQGKIVEDRTLTKERELSLYLSSRYPINRKLASRLSCMFLSEKVKGYSQLHTVMDDFMEHMSVKKGHMLTEKQAGKMLDKLQGSKIEMLFEQDVMEWRKEYGKDGDKEAVA